MRHRKTRTYDAGAIVMFTIRVEHGKLLMNPDTDKGRRVRDAVLACLCRAAERYGLEIFAFITVGNHIHLVMRSNGLHHSDFLRDFNSTVANQLRRIREEHDTRVFHRPADDVYVDGPDAFLRMMAYVLANACHHDLVDEPSEWTGASSWEATCAAGDHVLRGTWIDRDELRKIRRLKRKQRPESDAEVHHSITLARPGFWPEMSDEQYFQMLVDKTREYARRQRERRTRTGEKVQGMKKVSKCEPTTRVPMPEYAPHPGIHPGGDTLAEEEARTEEYLAIRLDILAQYDRAVERLCDDVPFSMAGFPHGTHPPGLCVCHHGDGPGVWQEFRRSAPGLDRLSPQGRDNYIAGRGIRVVTTSEVEKSEVEAG